ncbi:MAG TPA: tetratricopeptide repeat protein [Flavobacterium sp.]|nr:tetratricopeptide repeat protein [Flavobacterium sp.]
MDYLMSELSKRQNDTLKIKTLQDISYSWSELNPDEGIKYAEMAIALSEKLKAKSWQASSNGMLAISYNAKADYKAAILYNKKALSIYQELHNEKSSAAIYANLSLIYLNQSNYPEALKNSFSALKIYEDSKINKNTGIVLENIGHIYFEQKNYSKTEEYYNRALDIYRNVGLQEDIARALGNLARVFQAEDKCPKALVYLYESLETNKKLGVLNSVQNNLANIGNVYMKLGEYTKAIYYHSQALKISKRLGNESSIAINYGNLGSTWLGLANNKAKTVTDTAQLACLTLAISNLEQAVKICEKIGFNAPLSEFNQDLVDAYAQRGNYKEAFVLLKKNTALKDSVFSMQSKVELSGLETKRNLELKNKDIIIKGKQLQIKRLQSVNERMLYLSGIFLLCLILFIFARYIVRRIREHRNEMAHILHIQSHKIRGPVASILGLAQLLDYNNPEDPDNKEMLKGIYSIACDLDKVIVEVIGKHKPYDIKM